jgi:hypothetical protein
MAIEFCCGRKPILLLRSCTVTAEAIAPDSRTRVARTAAAIAVGALARGMCCSSVCAAGQPGRLTADLLSQYVHLAGSLRDETEYRAALADILGKSDGHAGTNGR